MLISVKKKKKELKQLRFEKEEDKGGKWMKNTVFQSFLKLLESLKY